MSNVKIVLKDTRIRLSHQSTISPSGDGNLNKNDPKEYYFDLEIPDISFKDETPGLDDEPTPPNTSGSASVTLPPAQAETVKSFTITGLNVWLREVTNQWINKKPPQQSPLLNIPKASSFGGEDSGDEFFDSHQGLGSDNSSESDEQKQIKPYEAMILSCQNKRISLELHCVKMLFLLFNLIHKMLLHHIISHKKLCNKQIVLNHGILKV